MKQMETAESRKEGEERRGDGGGLRNRGGKKKDGGDERQSGKKGGHGRGQPIIVMIYRKIYPVDGAAASLHKCGEERIMADEMTEKIACPHGQADGKLVLCSERPEKTGALSVWKCCDSDHIIVTPFGAGSGARCMGARGICEDTICLTGT